MLIYSRNSDPRTGVVEYRLTNINRAEPPADLFTIPSDYTINQPPVPQPAPLPPGPRGRGAAGAVATPEPGRLAGKCRSLVLRPLVMSVHGPWSCVRSDLRTKDLGKDGPRSTDQ